MKLFYKNFNLKKIKQWFLEYFTIKHFEQGIDKHKFDLNFDPIFSFSIKNKEIVKKAEIKNNLKIVKLLGVPIKENAKGIIKNNINILCYGTNFFTINHKTQLSTTSDVQFIYLPTYVLNIDKQLLKAKENISLKIFTRVKSYLVNLEYTQNLTITPKFNIVFYKFYVVLKVSDINTAQVTMSLKVSKQSDLSKTLSTYSQNTLGELELKLIGQL